MASIIKSNTYADFNGREILTADSNGNLTTQKVLTPFCEVFLTGNFDFAANNTIEKVTFDTVRTDDSNIWDSTNYRIKPNVPGHYFVFSAVSIAENNTNALQLSVAYIYKNGSLGTNNYAQPDYRTNKGKSTANTVNQTMYLNGTTDYVEIYALINSTGFTGSGNEKILNGGTFGLFRIGS